MRLTFSFFAMFPRHEILRCAQNDISAIKITFAQRINIAPYSLYKKRPVQMDKPFLFLVCQYKPKIT